MSGHGEKQAGHRNREQQNQRQQIVGELLHAHRATVTAASPHCREDSDQDHHRADVENIECQRSDQTVSGKLPTWMPKTKAR